MWLIPLFDGKPIIRRGSRGPAPRWRNPRKPAKTIIHVNSHQIRANQKHQQQQPVITVKNKSTNKHGHEVEIPGGCRIVYKPDAAVCGAKVWMDRQNNVKALHIQQRRYNMFFSSI